MTAEFVERDATTATYRYKGHRIIVLARTQQEEAELLEKSVRDIDCPPKWPHAVISFPDKFAPVPPKTVEHV